MLKTILDWLRYVKNPDLIESPETRNLVKTMKSTYNNLKNASKLSSEWKKQQEAYDNFIKIHNNLSKNSPSSHHRRQMWQYIEAYKAAEDAWVSKYIDKYLPYELKETAGMHIWKLYDYWYDWNKLPEINFLEERSIWYVDPMKIAIQDFKDLWNAIKNKKENEQIYNEMSNIPVEQRSIEQQQKKDEAYRNMTKYENEMNQIPTRWYYNERIVF